MQEKRPNLLKIGFSKLLKHGFSSIIFAFSLLGVLIIINYVIAIKTSYIDITKNKVHTLSSATQELLKDINYPIKIKAFYLLRDQQYISLLLDLYKKENKLITYEIYDPIKNPVVAEKNDIQFPRTIIFEAPNRTTRIDPPPRRDAINERDITLALYRLISNVTKTVYFPEGHGELSITNDKYNGISKVYDGLKAQNYIVKTINLQTTKRIPPDCSVLVIVDPKSLYSKEELKSIIEYQNWGGSVFLLVSPGLMPESNSIMSFYGIIYGNDFVYETASNRTTDRGPTSPLCKANLESAITSPLSNQNVLFISARSVNKKADLKEFTITPLLSTSKDSWAETDYKTIKNPKRDEDEQKGPIVVAVAAEGIIEVPDTTYTPPGLVEKKSRAAFFGSGGFITNSIVAQFSANMNIFLNTINWVTQNEKIMHIEPHTYVFTPIELKKSERKMISWLTLFIFPCTILMIGLIIWYQKR